MLYCQGRLEQLECQFDKIKHERLQYPKVGMVCLACVTTDMDDGSSDDVFLRGRIQNITDDKACADSFMLLATLHYIGLLSS